MTVTGSTILLLRKWRSFIHFSSSEHSPSKPPQGVTAPSRTRAPVPVPRSRSLPDSSSHHVKVKTTEQKKQTTSFAGNNVVLKGNSLTVDLCFSDAYCGGHKSNYVPPAATYTSPEYLVNCQAVFQAKVIRYQRTLLYFVKLAKKRENDKLSYTMKYTHRLNNPQNTDKSEECIITDNGRWQLLTEFQGDNCTFYVSLVIKAASPVNPCVTVCYDTELTDFELCSDDGSVHMHKVIAAAYSPVMKTSFTGEWGKQAKCVINAPPKTTKATLNHLKEYMYLGTLPEEGLKELLLLASFYMMSELELRCVQELLTDVTSEQAYDLIEFAMKHQMSQLIFEMMHRVQIGLIDAEQIQKHQNWDFMSFK